MSYTNKTAEKLDTEVLAAVIDEVLLRGGTLSGDALDVMECADDRPHGAAFSDAIRGVRLNPSLDEESAMWLIRYRLVLSGSPNPPEETVARLQDVRALYRVVHQYVAGNRDLPALSRCIIPRGSRHGPSDVPTLCLPLKFTLAATDLHGEGTTATERIGVLDACLRTLKRCEQYWEAIVGAPRDVILG